MTGYDGSYTGDEEIDDNFIVSNISVECKPNEKPPIPLNKSITLSCISVFVSEIRRRQL